MPAGVVPTTFEWSTIQLPNVAYTCIRLEIWRYFLRHPASPGVILCMGSAKERWFTMLCLASSANERRCYIVTLIGQHMGLLPDTLNWGLGMRRKCRERFPRHWLQRKPLVSNPGMHQGKCDTHVPWCMSGLLTRGGMENVPGIPGACTTRIITYLTRGP